MVLVCVFILGLWVNVICCLFRVAGLLFVLCDWFAFVVVGLDSIGLVCLFCILWLLILVYLPVWPRLLTRLRLWIARLVSLRGFDGYFVAFNL